MVLLNGSGVSPSEVVVRCLGLQVGEGDTTVDFGIAHVASEFSFTKECDTDSLQAQEINCTLTVTNVGETVLFSRDVWDFYNCDGLEFVSADPTSGDTWEEDGECGVDWEPEYWDADELYPGQSEQYHMTFVPADGADEAFNCVGGGAWNVRILLDGDDYYAWSEDVRVDEGACVDFAAPPSATPTPTPAATATPTPTPEAAPAAELPETGGEPADGSSGLPWLAAIAGAIAVMSVGGFWFAYRRRHVR
jgi:hypothetical protein